MSADRYIETFTGERFYTRDHRRTTPAITDIAHALANTCRYGGHCARFYSVAEHSCLVADWLIDTGATKAVAFVGLMHDAQEAYIGDMPSPLKAVIPAFAALEREVWEWIADEFALPYALPEIVKEADQRILIDERRALMSPTASDAGWPAVEPLGMPIYAWLPKGAEAEFLRRFRLLQP